MFAKLKGIAGQGGHDDGHANHDQSLTTILPTHEDRSSLVLLVAGATDHMRSQVEANFDPAMTNTIEPVKLGKSATTTDQLALKDEKAAERPAGKDGEEDEKTAEDIEKELAQRKKELAKPEAVELRNAAIESFDAWRDRVIQRVGEAINQQHESEKQTSSSHSTGSHSSTSNVKHSLHSQDDTLTLQKSYPPQDTPLQKLDEPKRVLILHSVLLLLLSLETYTAYSRVLMLHIASSLSLSAHILAEDETAVATGLIAAAHESMNADDETKKKLEENSFSRKWKVGLGAAAGAVLIGVTGGLAAPLLAAGVGSVMGGLGLGATAAAGYLGALAGSAPLVGVLFGAYGARMSGQMVDEYAKQVEDFAFIPIEGKYADKSTRNLRVAIAISGWLGKESEVVEPWQVIKGHGTEAFALRWELKALLSLGSALYSYITSYAWSFAKKEIISRTIFATLFSALTLPYGLAKASRIVDNPFSVARSRSEKAGAVLADALINKVQGERPVTLVGYSLGSRVIYSCLTELANRKAFGLVESVCFVGAPIPSDAIDWRRMRSVVAGRVINVYSTKDYLLGFLYRASSLQYGVSGLQSISDVPGIENVDVSDLVEGHTQYRFLIGSILQKVDIEEVDSELVEKQLARGRKENEKEDAERKKNESEADPKQFEGQEQQKVVLETSHGGPTSAHKE